MSGAFSSNGFSATGFDVDPLDGKTKQAEVWTPVPRPTYPRSAEVRRGGGDLPDEAEQEFIALPKGAE